MRSSGTTGRTGKNIDFISKNRDFVSVTSDARREGKRKEFEAY
jgi:uncharacterized LabA/DUF88 family protein